MTKGNPEEKEKENSNGRQKCFNQVVGSFLRVVKPEELSKNSKTRKSWKTNS